MSVRAQLESIAKGLAEHPAQVQITEVAGAKTQIFEIRCAKSDFGKLVGKGGKTVSALRVLLNALALKSGRRVALEVVDAAG
jgi:predicted RNA-binding protein YlqC (UPF0109 family)